MWTIVADSHFGICDPLQVVKIKDFLYEERSKGNQVIWNGDTFDLLRVETSQKDYQYMIDPKDVLIAGNHDYGILESRSLWIGKTFITHGDMLDFGYAFARLSQAGKMGGTWLENVLCWFRRWSVFDTFTLYQVLYELSDSDIDAFEHPHTKFKWTAIPSYFRILRKLIKSPVQPDHSVSYLSRPNGEGFGGYFTKDANLLLQRAFVLYPESKSGDTIIIGHLHYPIDQFVYYGGKRYRLICLGALKDKNATYVNIDEDGFVSVHCLSGEAQ